MLGNLADPMIYMLGLGYGLGAMLSRWAACRASHFSRPATVCSNDDERHFRGNVGVLRMHVQKTWDAIMNAPVSLDDVVLGDGMGGEQEPALRHCRARRGVGFGLTHSALALWVIPVVFLTGSPSPAWA